MSSSEAGGYVAGPMVLAARLRRIPTALTEADARLGLANRLAAPFARHLPRHAIAGRDDHSVARRGATDPDGAPSRGETGRRGEGGSACRRTSPS